ncbi:helix-turn-helix transcriptional regulator [Candidatus Woesearchaeota archaeon]|nr:helix-turn-helix transcriptional regulator [Candidatus Woesearchaeota archaeon]
MGKASFLLVSLQEEKAKELAAVMGSDSCKKILEHLGEHEGTTESDIARQLQLPLSTVHYNISHLQKANLIVSEEFHYSPKGKEVNHYKLANKYIIIAPKGAHGMLGRLKTLLPAGLLALAGAGFLAVYQKILGSRIVSKMASPIASSAIAPSSIASPAMIEKAIVAKDAAQEIAIKSAAQAPNTFIQAAEPAQALAGEPILQAAAPSQSLPSEPNIALWFLIGAITVLGIIFLIEWIRLKREK